MVSAVTLLAACGLSVVGTDVLDPTDAGTEGAAPGVDGGTSPGRDGAPSDAAAPDAQLDAGGADSGCPAVCNDGCLGGDCRVRNPTSAVTCPAGMACLVQCAQKPCRNIDCTAATSCEVECGANQGCDGITISCGSGPCLVECADMQGCNSVSISAGASAAFCIDCQGDDGCNSVTCGSASPGTKKCAVDHCGTVSGCGTLAAALSCP